MYNRDTKNYIIPSNICYGLPRIIEELLTTTPLNICYNLPKTIEELTTSYNNCYDLPNIIEIDNAFKESSTSSGTSCGLPKTIEESSTPSGTSCGLPRMIEEGGMFEESSTPSGTSYGLPRMIEEGGMFEESSTPSCGLPRMIEEDGMFEESSTPSCGLPRMIEEDGMIEESSTPHPTNPKINISFGLSLSKHSQLSKLKAMRTKTNYVLSSHPQFVQHFTALEYNVDSGLEEITKKELQVLRNALSRKYIRFDVSTVLSQKDLENMFDEIKKEEEVLKKELYTLSRNCKEYNECLKKHNNIKLWLDNYKTNNLTQRVRIHSFSAFLFRNILSPETTRRNFISLDYIIKSVVLDIQNFLTSPKMRSDRKLVVQQIIDSIPIKRKLDH